MVYYSIKTLDDLLSEGGQTFCKSSFARSNSSVGTHSIREGFFRPWGLKLRGGDRRGLKGREGVGFLGLGQPVPSPSTTGSRGALHVSFPSGVQGRSLGRQSGFLHFIDAIIAFPGITIVQTTRHRSHFAGRAFLHCQKNFFSTFRGGG